MTVKQIRLECLGKMTGHIDRCVNPVEEDKVMFHPFADQEILDIDMSSTRRGFLSIAHCGAAIVVLIA